MTKITCFVSAAFLSLLCLANLDGALPENTAAPGDLTCGRAPCHNIPVNVGDAQVSLVFNQGDSTYRADSTYRLTVKIQNPTTVRNGFQILALNANNQNTGTWLLSEPTKMKIISGISFPNRRYVTHKAAGNQQSEWTLQWKAPSANVGKVTFYASVLSANNNGLNTGDHVYTTKTGVLYAASSPTESPSVLDCKVYPTPAVAGLWVETPTSVFHPIHFALYNLAGTLLKEMKATQPEVNFIETRQLPDGVYVLVISAGTARSARKILVQSR